MNNRSITFAAALLLGAGFHTGVNAGTPAAPAPPAVRTFLPDSPAGSFTLGTQFSEHLSGVYLDSITGLWAPEKGDAFLFLDGRYHSEDDGQFISSMGLGFRKLLPEQKIIVGANVFWDAIHSERENDFSQFGLGLEVLSEWVDARLNYYRPEEDRYEVSRTSRRSSRTTRSANGITRTTERLEFQSFEAGLEGVNAEVGVKLPWLDRYAETRAYLGYYHYDNPFGRDFKGFKARLEARVLRGVTANVEYWEDAALMGGHWTAGVAVSVPFSLYNLFTGKNPLEGASDSFKRLPRRFEDRMGDVVERSHRIQTTTSSALLTGASVSITTAAAVQAPRNAPPPPPIPGGGFPVE
jgi:hypothetical protein